MLASLLVAFLVGLVLGSFLPYLPFTVLLILVAAGVGTTLLERRLVVTTRRSLILFGGLVAGVVYWTAFISLSAGTPIGHVSERSPVAIEGTVVEPVRHAEGRDVIVLSVSRIEEEGRSTAVQVRLRLTWRNPDLSLHHGDRITTVARIRPPTGLINPGGFDYESYLERHGIEAVASVSGPGQVTLLERAALPHLSILSVIDTWRDRIRAAALSTLSSPAAGVYLGMIIGEPDYLSPEIRDRFMASGTVHILSISGSHLGLIAWLAFLLVKTGCRSLPAAWLLRLSRYTTPTRLAAVLTVVPVTFYTLLAGAQIATVRSLVMIVLFLIAVWLGRENSLVPALAVAAFIILLADPRAVFDISFQLSFLSVLAIALVIQWNARMEDRPEGWVPKIRMWLKNYFFMTAGVTLATVPLVAFYFHQIAWLGLLANLIVIPFAGFLLVPFGLGTAIWLLAAGSGTLPAGSMNEALAEGLIDLVDLLGRIPGAEWHVASPLIPAIAAFYVMLYTASRPGGRSAIRAAAAVLAGLILLWWVWSPRASTDGETLRVTFLDVGQGDAAMIELPDRRTILIDGGPAYEALDMGRAVIGPYLWNRGIFRLDDVIATHPQLDHVGGLIWTVRQFRIERYWTNGISRQETFYRRLQAALEAQSTVQHTAEEGRLIVDSGPCRLRILNPPADGSAPPLVRKVRTGSGLNDLSVVTRLDCGPHSFLFTGDVETEAIVRLQASEWFDAEVVKVPHHGSKSSFQPQWVAHLNADAAVVSVGRINPYGHPSAGVIDAYERRGIHLLRTDRQGAIQITARLSLPSLEIHGTRDNALVPTTFGPEMLNIERENLTRLWRQWIHRGIWEA